MGVRRYLAGVVYFAKAGEGVGNGVFTRIWREIEEDERLALTEDCDRFTVVADVGLKGDDPCAGLDLFGMEDDLPAVLDFYGVFGFEAGTKMNAPRLIRLDVDQDAISGFADEDGAVKSGLPEAVRGGEAVGLCLLILEVFGGLVSGNPVDAEFYGCLRALDLGR